MFRWRVEDECGLPGASAEGELDREVREGVKNDALKVR